MPIEFTVVGEHKEDNRLLLLLGADGQYYVYFPDTEEVAEIDPYDDWEIFERREDVEPEFFTLGMEEPG